MPALRKSAIVKAITASRKTTPAAPDGLPLVDEIPPPPDWLPNAHAIKEWNRLAPILVAAKRLPASGLSALGMLCSMHGQNVQMLAAGQFPTAAQHAQYRNICRDFGLTGAEPGGAEPPKGNRFANNGRRPGP